MNDDYRLLDKYKFEAMCKAINEHAVKLSQAQIKIMDSVYQDLYTNHMQWHNPEIGEECWIHRKEIVEARAICIGVNDDKSYDMLKKDATIERLFSSNITKLGDESVLAVP